MFMHQYADGVVTYLPIPVLYTTAHNLQIVCVVMHVSSNASMYSDNSVGSH